MRELEYVVLDVFAERRFEGNQLAVFGDATGLTDDQMQVIAREMNLSETVFVLPRAVEVERERGVRVRIFTTEEELPFAGHPTLGAATWVRLHHAEFGGATEILLEENVGTIPVRFAAEDGRVGMFGTMRQNDPVFGAVGGEGWPTRGEFAEALGLAEGEIGLAEAEVTVRVGAKYRGLSTASSRGEDFGRDDDLSGSGRAGGFSGFGRDDDFSSFGRAGGFSSFGQAGGFDGGREGLGPVVAPVQVVSTGSAFCVVPLRSMEVMERLAIPQAKARPLLARVGARFFYCVARVEAVAGERMEGAGEERAGWRGRMQFYNGEDPATGSAAGCVAAWLVEHGLVESGREVVLEQGVEIRRPSRLTLRATKRAGSDGGSGGVTDVFVGGRTIPVATGRLFLP